MGCFESPGDRYFDKILGRSSNLADFHSKEKPEAIPIPLIAACVMPIFGGFNERGLKEEQIVAKIFSEDAELTFCNQIEPRPGLSFPFTSATGSPYFRI